MRTTVRAVRELKDAGLVKVIKNGYKALGRKPVAAIYELLILRFADTPEADATQEWPELPEADATLDGVLDGSIDGSIDGGAARASEPPSRPPFLDFANALPANNSFEEPRCERHHDRVRYPTAPNCRDCRDVRLQHEQETAMKTAQERATQTAAAEARRAAIAACDLCDEYGFVKGPDGGVTDRAIRCSHEGDGR